MGKLPASRLIGEHHPEYGRSSDQTENNTKSIRKSINKWAKELNRQIRKEAQFVNNDMKKNNQKPAVVREAQTKTTRGELGRWLSA